MDNAQSITHFLKTNQHDSLIFLKLPEKIEQPEISIQKNDSYFDFIRKLLKPVFKIRNQIT